MFLNEFEMDRNHNLNNDLELDSIYEEVLNYHINDYTIFEATLRRDFLEVNGKSIAAIKFKSSPANDSPFMGSFALFGTNVPDASYENVRNSSKWERIIDKTEVNNPYVEKGSDWTDWYPTNVYTKNSNGNYEFTQYSKYVLEIYSPDSSSAHCTDT